MAIISKDGNLLLTKRAAQLKFPNAWVMPGGHIDVGESLEACVVREVREETGIIIPSDKVDIQPYYTFESNTGRTSGPDLIKRGHLIVFFRAQLDVDSADIKLTTQQSEVQQSLWVSKGDIEYVLLNQNEKYDTKRKGVDDCNNAINICLTELIYRD
jgi:8-oxo-dGTP pyrophosphatase MutT (NUDIX family)